MSVNKEIRFSAKDTGVSQTMNRLRADSKRLHEDMLRDAQSSTSSQKEALKYYEEQIKLIERRNRLDRETSKFELKEKFDRGMESAAPTQRSKLAETFKQQMGQLDSDSESDKLQVQILRDLLETTKQQHREELRHESTESTKDRMHEERLSLGKEKDESRRETSPQSQGAIMAGVKGVMYARGLSNLLEQGERGGRGALSTVSSGLMMSGNPYAMAAGGIMEFLTGAFGLVQKQQQMVHTSAVLTGRETSSLAASGFGYGGTERIERIGMDREQYLQRYEGSVRSYGRGISEEQSMRDIYAEKAMGLDSGVVSQIQNLTRTMSEFSEVQQVTNEVHRAMVGTGALGSGNIDMARMNAIVSTAVQMQESRFQRTGLQTGFSERLGIMRGLEGMGGSFKDDQYKQATLQQLESGIATTPNKMVHAMKLRQARELFPEQNPFELFATIQSGDPRLIAPMIEQLASSTQDDTLLMQRMSDMFGGQLSPQNVVAITKGVRQGKKIEDMLPGQVGQGVAGEMYRERAQESTPAMNAEALKLWNEAIVKSTELMGSLTSKLETLLGLI